MPGIPDRWGEYTALGEKIGNTKFIPFKVPLKPALCKNLPEVERFTPTHLLNKVEKLGLVIDLTNTRRYYDPEEFVNSGVHYVKIFCQGRGSIPDFNIVRKFYDAVHHFQNVKKDDLIGVHCTHGLNRTGYLICRYMIENLGYSAENAIKEFNKARGHDIERAEYLRDLYKIEARCLDARNSEDNGTRHDITRKHNDPLIECRDERYFDHTSNLKNIHVIYKPRHYQSNNVHYHNSPRNSRGGKNNRWYNYDKYYELHNETMHHLPQRYNSFQASYGNRDYHNTHHHRYTKYPSCPEYR